MDYRITTKKTTTLPNWFNEQLYCPYYHRPKQKTYGLTPYKTLETPTTFLTQPHLPTTSQSTGLRHRFLWNHYLKEGPRTPNHLEGWHNKIQKKVRHAHPCIYEIIDLLQTTQTMTEITIIQYAAGARPPKRPTYRRIDSRLQQLKDKIPKGVSYSDRVCRCCFPPTSPLIYR